MEEGSGAHSYAHMQQSHSLKLVEIARATLYLAWHASLKSQQGNWGFWNADPSGAVQKPACTGWHLLISMCLFSPPHSVTSLILVVWNQSWCQYFYHRSANIINQDDSFSFSESCLFSIYQLDSQKPITHLMININ